jgi:hypothetical protein
MLPHLRKAHFCSQCQSYVMTDGQPASLSWCQVPIWGLQTDCYYYQPLSGLLMWSALSDERMSLPFTTDACPRQRSHSWVWVQRDSWPYFTVSDLRLPQPGGPGHLIYIPQALRSLLQSKSHCNWPSVSKSWCQATSGAHDQIFITRWQLRSCFCGTSSLTKVWVCLLYKLPALASVFFSSPSPLGLATIFYCLIFETSLFVALTTRRVTVEVFNPAFTRASGNPLGDNIILPSQSWQFSGLNFRQASWNCWNTIHMQSIRITSSIYTRH